MVKVKLINAHVLEGLKQIPDESVQCVVTSPPYWGLRDYGIEEQIWGGEEGCGHEWGDELIQKGEIWKKEDLNCSFAKSQPTRATSDAWEKVEHKSQFCRLCGAWRGSYGLEPTLELYIQHTVKIFREVRRVLRKDGVLWLNLGDSYTSGGRNTRDPGQSKIHPSYEGDNYKKGLRPGTPPGLKPKDLCGIPWRVALALQADGWWLRSDIIWAKPNPMPESCTDRPTKSHEYIFLLTKSAKYYWDQEAVRESLCESTIQRDKTPRGRRQNGGGSKISMQGVPYTQALGNMQSNPGGRNLRSVWEIATAPFPQAHFATFPPAIPERCIKAGTSEKGCCPKCGAGWVRVVEKELKKSCNTPGKGGRQIVTGSETSPSSCFRTGLTPQFTTTGWQPTCSCGLDPVPQTVLDPFSGAGTTAMVAAKLGRDAIGIELNPEYVEMSRKRIAQELGFLADVEVICPNPP